MADFDIEYDLVVCGSGASGKSAALEAAKAGKRVVILEKMPDTGGSSMYAEGIAAFDSIEQRERKTPDNPKYHFPTPDEAYDTYMSFSHDRANNEVVRAFVDNAAETIQIYRDLGAEFITVCTEVLDHVPEESDELWSFHMPVGHVSHLQDLLLAAVKREGVDIFCSTPAKELIVEDGKVVGVVAESEGQPLRVGGKAVVLATGGVGDNKEFLKKYGWSCPGPIFANKYTPLENVGDGLKMALAVGADPNNLVAVPTLGPSALGRDLSAQSGALAMQPGVWVNRLGKRFIDETAIDHALALGGKLAKQPDAVVWSIVSKTECDRFAKEGPDFGLGLIAPAHAPMPTLWDEVNSDVEKGLAFKADTIEELAGKIDVPADALAHTLEEYNASCDAGYDRQFRKDPQYLRAMKEGPYYAIGIATGTMGCQGGVKVNGNMQVVDVHYDPIPGLYAVGWDAEGLYGDTYCFKCPGSGNGFAHTSGRLAGRHFVATCGD